MHSFLMPTTYLQTLLPTLLLTEVLENPQVTKDQDFGAKS